MGNSLAMGCALMAAEFCVSNRAPCFALRTKQGALNLFSDDGVSMESTPDGRPKVCAADIAEKNLRKVGGAGRTG